MKCPLSLAAVILLFPAAGVAGVFDDLTRELLPAVQESSLDDTTVVRGVKEALATGTERAVKEVAKPDGYFGNRLIRILLPDKIQQVANVIGTLGYQSQVDELVLSMNRAAEKAAPKAAGFFGDAIRQMSVEDAKGILAGGDRAATDFFEKKTRGRLFEAFKPAVTKSMEQVGTVRAYKNLLDQYEALPVSALTGTQSLNLDDYVTNKALDGLFAMIGAEEKKIRTDPAARTTDLLRTVFGQ